MKTLWTIVSLLIMIVGLFGTVLPFFPGIVLIYAGYLFYGFVTDWQAYGATTVVVWGIVTCLLALLDFYAGSIGAKKFGASRFGMWGAFIGGGVGALFGLPGLILGPFVGAVVGELMGGRSHRQAFRAAWGSFIGFVTGGLLRIVVGVVMIGTFLWLVL
ncbi:MAG: DUF456 domain-containing protein [Syntrophales bacterium]